MVIKVTRLFVHPVKSLGGFAVAEAAVDAMGLAGDRRFMAVDTAGKFLTQRALPRMALIAARLRGDRLELSVRDGSSVSVGVAPDPAAPELRVTVWKSEGLLAEDCGDDAAAWLGGFLGCECRLARIGPRFRRAVHGRGDDLVSFADGQPALLASEASLDLLNDRLVAAGTDAGPLGWDRFRPNIVVSGCPAHGEDGWERIRIGDTEWRADGPCARCPIPATDQQTARRGPEPLRTLATYRRDPRDSTQVNFGINLINETKAGIIRVGDLVAVGGR